MACKTVIGRSRDQLKPGFAGGGTPAADTDVQYGQRLTRIPGRSRPGWVAAVAFSDDDIPRQGKISVITDAFPGASPRPADAVVAHGIAATDLPLPFPYVVTGAALAVGLSFVLLGVLWRTPALDGRRALPLRRCGRVLDASVTRGALRTIGLVVIGYVGMAALFGADLATNPVFGFVYVLLWVGLLPASMLLGPVWRVLNPIRTLHLLIARLLRVDPAEGLFPLPPRLGYWPAALGLTAFVWLELVAPQRDTLLTIQAWFALYFMVQLIAGAAYGSRWFDHGDAFEVLSTAWARLGPWGRGPASGQGRGALLLRWPLDNTAAWPSAPGLAAVVVVLLGATGYDAASNTPPWVRWTRSTPTSATIDGTVGLLLVIAVIGLAYAGALALAAWLAGPARASGRQLSARELPGQFAHTLLPIGAGYLVAHYFTLLVLAGQRAIIALSDPLVNGGDWLGLADVVPVTRWVTPALVANVQVGAIVVGHVLGVVLAHDRALRLWPGRRGIWGQLPLLVLMVGITVVGLLLLLAG